jgi:N-acetylmuramoyl-L-alanine amidase
MGGALILYYTLLKPDSNFTFNRFYLLATLILALTVPVLNFSTTNRVPVLNKINIETIYEINNKVEQYTEEEAIISSDTHKLPFHTILSFIYLLGVLIMAIRFLVNLLHIIHSIKNKGRHINGFNVVFNNNYSNPYSFFNNIFISKEHFQNNESFGSLFEHEKAHCKQLHSLDILIIEVIKCFLWFNPLVWVYKTVISENHEYLADSKAVRNVYSKEKYLSHIIHFSNNNSNTSILISGFSFKNTKSRILMLNKPQKPLRKRKLKLALIIVMTGSFFILNSFKTKSTNPFLVVVDAGHGGKDNGAISNHINEKGINLNIGSKLASLDGQNNIKIILLRNEDEFLSLENRVKKINELKPDLLLSIHCNYSKNRNLNGTEVYYSDQEKFKNQSYNYSKTINSAFLENVSDKSKIKTANYFIFKHSECPAILLQVGFLSNSHDLSFLNDTDYQDKIAYTIYSCLEKISNNQ